MAKKHSRPRIPEFSEEKKHRFRRRQILFGSFLLLIGLLLALSFFSFFFHYQSDQSTLDFFFEKEIPSKNLLSKVGSIEPITTFLIPVFAIACAHEPVLPT